MVETKKPALSAAKAAKPAPGGAFMKPMTPSVALAAVVGASPLSYPAWEILPHEGKLPHADVISDRLQTLVSLSDNSKSKTQNSKLTFSSGLTSLVLFLLPSTVV